MRFWVNLSNRRNQHSRPRQLQHQQRRLRNAVPLHAADCQDILSPHHRVGLCLYLSVYRTTDLNKWLGLFYTVRYVDALYRLQNLTLIWTDKSQSLTWRSHLLCLVFVLSLTFLSSMDICITTPRLLVSLTVQISQCLLTWPCCPTLSNT